MKFISLLNELKSSFGEDILIRKNGAVLLKPGKVPVCRHELFPPLEQEYIETYFVNQYLNPFPSEYADFLRNFNGANLFNIKFLLKPEGFEFGQSMLTLFGLPLSPPDIRDVNGEEPFDLRVEDTDRHKNVPRTWLKCGCFLSNNDYRTIMDIFIDTTSHRVFVCEKRKSKIEYEWDNLDCALCDIFKMLLDCNEVVEV